MSQRRRIDVGWLLLLTPVLWGATFPAAKLGLERIGVYPFMAWTRFIGFVSILLATVLLARRDLTVASLRRVVLPGLLLGGTIFVAYTLQTEGLARTTATNAGFITGLYVVFVPLLGLALFQQPVGWALWLAVGVSMVGLTLLSIPSLEEIQLRSGDVLVLLSSVAWAAQVVALGRLVNRHPTMLLSLSQMGWAAALHVATTLMLGEGLRASEAASDAWLLLVVTGILGSGVAYTLQVIAQTDVSPSRAVVILASESVAAAGFSAIWLGERLEAHQWIGASLVLLAMVLSEVRARRVDLRAETAAPT